MLGEHIERRSALSTAFSYFAAAAILIFLLLQAALGSWRLAALSIIGVPVVVAGGLLAIVVRPAALLPRLAARLRRGAQPCRAQRHHDGQRIASTWSAARASRSARRWSSGGVQERASAVVATAITTALLFLPLCRTRRCRRAWRSPTRPAWRSLGGLVTSTLLTLVVVPALYLALWSRHGGRRRGRLESGQGSGEGMTAAFKWMRSRRAGERCKEPASMAHLSRITAAIGAACGRALRAIVASATPRARTRRKASRRKSWRSPDRTSSRTLTDRKGGQAARHPDRGDSRRSPSGTPDRAVRVGPLRSGWRGLGIYHSGAADLVRDGVVVELIEGDNAYLKEGPPAGTLVVTVGVSELYGTEEGVGH